MTVAAAFLIAFFVTAAMGGEKDEAIIVLNSYHNGYSWSDNEMQGIRAVMKKSSFFDMLRFEYLDAKYFPAKELDSLIVPLLKRKYGNTAVPVVLATDNPSLEFATKHRGELFPDAAIVFCGINGYRDGMIRGMSRITGVAERLDTRRTVEMMLELHPETSEIVVVHDYTPTGLATRQEAEEDLACFSGRVAIRYLGNLPTSSMLAELARLREGSLVLALSYSRDQNGLVYDHGKIAELLGNSSPVPVYGTHEERIGKGITGGYLIGGRSQGERAAQLALRILKGADPTSMKVEQSPAAGYFDFRQMQRFGIGEGRLPRGSVVINKPSSVYQQYKTIVWAAAGVVAALVVINTLLIMLVRQKRQSARDLLVKAEELERANKELQEFTFLSYHDLQEPLREICSFAQLLESKCRDRLTGEALEYLGFIVVGSGRLKAMFSDFLDYCSYARSPVVPEQVSLNEVLRDVVAEMKGVLDDSMATVHVAELPAVKGNPRQIRAMVRHLLGNSLKFRSEIPPVISINGAVHEGMAEISVSDNGIGIESEYLEKVFGIFKKMHSRRDIGGSGIGLAICRKIVETNGGRIWAESRGGAGATFTFTLPAAPQSS